MKQLTGQHLWDGSHQIEDMALAQLASRSWKATEDTATRLCTFYYYEFVLGSKDVDSCWWMLSHSFLPRLSSSTWSNYRKAVIFVIEIGHVIRCEINPLILLLLLLWLQPGVMSLFPDRNLMSRFEIYFYEYPFLFTLFFIACLFAVILSSILQYFIYILSFFLPIFSSFFSFLFKFFLYFVVSSHLNLFHIFLTFSFSFSLLIFYSSHSSSDPLLLNGNSLIFFYLILFLNFSFFFSLFSAIFSLISQWN